jgi:Tfp pilus assembly protein PilV
MVILSGFLVVISVLAMSLRLAAQSRDRTYAYNIANNLLEKIHSHEYGYAMPATWEQNDYIVSAEEIAPEKTTTPSVTEFTKKITYSNGSFFGHSTANSDVLTITITWYEGTGIGSARTKKEFKVKTEVRRNAPDDT